MNEIGGEREVIRCEIVFRKGEKQTHQKDMVKLLRNNEFEIYGHRIKVQLLNVQLLWCRHEAVRLFGPNEGCCF